MTFVIQLMSGLAVGCIYGLVAIGFSMIYRAMGLVNFAQADIMMIGAFLGYAILVAAPGIPFWLAIIGAMLGAALLGFVIERVAIRPSVARRADQVYLVLLTLGIGIVLSNGARLIWGADPVVYPTGLTHQTLTLAGYPLPAVYLYIAVVMPALLVGLHLFFTRTWLGLALRAAADDPDTAATMGVRPALATSVSFALASAIGAAAGVLYAPISYVSFDMGVIGVKAFAAAVVGTLGSIPGAVLGGFIIGLGETFGGQLIATEYQDSIAFAIMIGILLLKPTGLLSGARR
ncbi:branched-chain amino acid ABC transporter permease [Enterovirga rhinocerotis]|uniref:Amino acid/amide ABC transporter membrane protein 1 (HAAT family) n=1 Tax=Enterovirga rhinocerotis TaxID=1339210 RepID=A0A4R7CDY5_9HYPH|nr:branched-chain amino acid ABC transporter permease [Enterovirga rhinocerotis]TDR95057.1 amino acid/amide ABC transporter membrane protein 1 (HAAT family) [Enterovirga rhinocerotis]